MALTAMVAVSLLVHTGPALAATAAPPADDVALRKYADMDTKDVEDLLGQLRQEVLVNQQKQIAIQFMLEHGSAIDMDFVRYPSGLELIPGYVFTAKGARKDGQRRPAVVVVHGGFHERLNVEWFPMIEALVSHGYVVMFPEYRGSRGYGEQIYANDYGVTDVADVLAARQFVADKPYVDASRIGIVGESRGGMVTLLAIEKEPKAFRAAVDIVGLTDFVAYMAYKPDYRRQQVARESPSFGGKLPSENLAAYMAVSPINNVDAIETPLLILANSWDQIVPVKLHTGRLVDALKARDKVFEVKIYDSAPGGHVFMHGDTKERADGIERILAWLEKYGVR